MVSIIEFGDSMQFSPSGFAAPEPLRGALRILSSEGAPGACRRGSVARSATGGYSTDGPIRCKVAYGCFVLMHRPFGFPECKISAGSDSVTSRTSFRTVAWRPVSARLRSARSIVRGHWSEVHRNKRAFGRILRGRLKFSDKKRRTRTHRMGLRRMRLRHSQRDIKKYQ